MEDRDIICLYFARNQDAIVETSQKYGGFLRALAMRILSSHEEAEETVNEVYMRAWNAIPPAQPEKLGSFLARITRNTAIDRLEYLRAEKRGGNTNVDALLSELSDCIPDDSDVESDVLGREIGVQINTFLATLHQESRVFFLNRYFYAYSIAEIAEKTGASQARIKSSLYRTRNRLREFLRQEGIL